MTTSQHRTRILIQRADRLGDMVVALPTIEALAERYPNARIDVISSEIGKAVLENHPKINAIIEAKFTPNGKLEGKAEIKKKLQKGCYDIYIGLWNEPQLAWLAFQARIPVRIGDRSKWPLRYLYTHTVDAKPNLITQHQVEYNLRHLAPLGIPVPETPITALYPTPEAVKEVEVEFKKYYRPRIQWLAICVATGGSNSPIPESAIIDLIIALDPEEWNIVLIGPENSPELFKRLPNPNIIKSFGHPISQAVAEIDYCNFYIGPDTGLTHIASFLKKPMIQVSPMPKQFPGRWAPVSPYFDIIRKEYLHCHHSPTKPCGASCQSYITGEVLFKALDNLIYKVNIKDPFTKKQAKTKRLAHTFRVLVVADTEFDFLKYRRFCTDWEESQLIMIPIRLHKGIAGAVQLINECLKHNVTVIHGNVHPIIQFMVRTIIDKVVQYVKPIFTSHLPITEHISPDDYLTHYEAVTKKQ